ncbi:bifunctional salicylyl-CoA 5-hydroxylase/oxidoreductase [Nesterenkonia natronophila]|uniref:Bifunctional salicylyl-CoA 5-hydroxylase/oxidoreductase n=1 Tax=Nesterenkonia natronophila TaxID=2174932 RepID=A0A3A4FBE6_9MICC|nr:bifunctional salicylyl-CoA 5-hydroxylase/oxidoreductase [Nesterenkonia natronophila]RJN32437.1 bifunctional salicylyl-CoA 5-hydroxylase/oxidoreductase [Nesterenkonia natronophila]
MKTAIVGGGPAGLYFSILMKQLDPHHEIVVWERNRADDTFGFGVVFSDETLGGIENADSVVADYMTQQFARWSDIDIHYRGQEITVGGQGFAAMGRKELLQMLQQRALNLGVTVHFASEAPPVAQLEADYDLVLAADGANSQVRAAYADDFRPQLDRRRNKFMWLGTDQVFEAFKFFIKETKWGVMQVHGYPFSDKRSTFIVEMHEDVWRRAGFDSTEDTVFPPGVSDDQAVDRLREIFAEELAGYELITNNSKWINFGTVRCDNWSRGNVVLVGDAAHTAHFSIGSGTKLAMEDALALAACLHENADVPAALKAYETERRPVVESTQRSAQASLEWFEDIDRYVGQDDLQFAFNLLTRSRRITQENLRLRDPEFAQRVDQHFAASHGLNSVEPAMFQPGSIGPVRLKNRVIVSPMDMYSAEDGVAGNFHLVHLGSKALGGAGLVMTEMACVSAEGRITPGCSGLYTGEHTESWKEVVDFVHHYSTAKIGVQLGHSGRKGSTKLMWEGIDNPLESGNWQTMGPSAVPYGPNNQVPREMTRSDMDKVVVQFVQAAQRAAEAGFDLLEVHAAHGYLLSSFLSPISNKRTDEYGGPMQNRLRFPLEVFDAIREVWPEDRALTVRISATDWYEEGNTVDDAVEIAQAFVDHGAHAIDVSSGQVTKLESPAYGRSYQTPFADRIRHEVTQPAGVKVIAVGAISSYDDLNSILLAGRADFCALGRPHLYNPNWTLNAAAEQGIDATDGTTWPNQFRAGRRKPPTSGRTDDIRPRLALVREDPEDQPTHLRWRPESARSLVTLS